MFSNSYKKKPVSQPVTIRMPLYKATEKSESILCTFISQCKK